MSYASIADVQAHVPTQQWPCGIDSQPSQAMVQGWLAAQSQWIDSVLRWKYQTPVTDATDLLIVQQACALLVAAMVWDVKGGMLAEGQIPPSSGLRKAAYQLLVYDGKCGEAQVLLPNTALASIGQAGTAQQPISTFTTTSGTTTVAKERPFFDRWMEF